MGLDGVRSVNFVRLTQGDEPDFTELFPTRQLTRLFMGELHRTRLGVG